MDLSLIDNEQVKILRSLDAHGDVFARLVRLFHAEVESQLNELEERFQEKNFTVCKYLVHSIKSSALNIGARKLAGLAESLEVRLSSPIVNISQGDVLELRRVFNYSSERLKGESSQEAQ